MGRGTGLRVLVDAVSARTGGGGTYIVAQMEALARISDLELTIYATGEVGRRLAVVCSAADVRVRSAVAAPRRLLWEQAGLAREARHHDVVYAPGNFALIGCPRPQVLVIQNAWYFTDPVRRFRRARCPAPMRARLTIESALARGSIRRANRVLAVSRTMLEAIEADLGPVAHAGVLASATPRPVAVVAELPGELTRRIGRDYALVVAHDDPHKEWDRLIEIFLTRLDLPELVLAGRVGDQRRTQLQQRIAADGAARVHVLGQVADPAVLAALYRNAGCVVAHSRFESFGLTPCEALAYGRAVAAADIPAHREVCGTAVTYYDPADDSALADAVMRAPHGMPDASQMPRRTWEQNAAELATALREAASGQSAPAGAG